MHVMPPAISAGYVYLEGFSRQLHHRESLSRMNLFWWCGREGVASYQTGCLGTALPLPLAQLPDEMKDTFWTVNKVGQVHHRIFVCNLSI